MRFKLKGADSTHFLNIRISGGQEAFSSTTCSFRECSDVLESYACTVSCWCCENVVKSPGCCEML